MKRLERLTSGHAQLLRHLCGSGVLRSSNLINAFLRVDRAKFVLPDYQAMAYVDEALPIGHGVTISQPSTVAFMLELLQPQLGDKILSVGAGSGWQTALLAEAVGDKGHIYAIERIPQLAEQARQNLAPFKHHNITLITGDGSVGLADQAPFNGIIVSAAAHAFPRELKNQLAIGGRLILPIGEHTQDIMAVSRLSDDEFDEERYPGFVFVPLIEGEYE